MFIDYLTVWQQHDHAFGDFLGGRVFSIEGAGGLSRVPVVLDDVHAEVWALDTDSDIDYMVGKFKHVSGSYETSLSIRMLAGRVEVRGNPSAYGRLDNLFGLTSLDQCIDLYNRVLSELGLPQFTEGTVKSKFSSTRAGEFKLDRFYDGAQITRIDVTENLAVGMGNVRKYNQWALAQKIYRTAADDDDLSEFRRWNYETVYLSQSKNWIGFKVYDKGQALLDRSLVEYKRKLKLSLNSGAISQSRYNELCAEADDYLTKLATWCFETGVARAEVSFKNRFFTQNPELKFYKKNVSEKLIYSAAGVEMDKLLSRAVVFQESQIDDLTASEFKLYSLWKRGVDVKEITSKTSFYRSRSAILKKIGCDIAARSVKTNEVDFKPVYFRVAPLQLAAAPSFYRQAELRAA